MNESDGKGEERDRSAGANDGDFSAAVQRLEKAVQEIVTVTTGQAIDRATTLLDDTTKRLEAELRLRRVRGNEDADRLQEHGRASRRGRHRLADLAERVNPASGRLYRDPQNQKIGGVCAGLANYFGVDAWMIRGLALGGLFLLPGIVFPAYWIAYFVMETPQHEDKRSRRAERRRRRRGEVDAPAAGTSAAGRAREFEPPTRFVAKRSLKHCHADLSEAELRLRRLESFVTSDQYELHKELARMEQDEGRSHG